MVQSQPERGILLQKPKHKSEVYVASCNCALVTVGKKALYRFHAMSVIMLWNWARLSRGVSKQGVMTFEWRPGSQYDVAATRGADNGLASDCRAQFGRPSTRRGCRICVTVQLAVRPSGEIMYWQANANIPLSVTGLTPEYCGKRPPEQ